jgi:signal recognition particle receptor subunit beta
MAIVNFGKKEISIKILYWGIELSGKTQNLLSLSKILNAEKTLSLTTPNGRTIFFDFKPLTKKLSNGYSLRFLLYTTPGNPFCLKTRELLFNGTDGIVFVVDSKKEKLEENLNALHELLALFNKKGKNITNYPLVFQYNKRDLSDALPVKYLREKINYFHKPDFQAIATKGVGVKETFNEITKLSTQSILEQIGLRT